MTIATATARGEVTFRKDVRCHLGLRPTCDTADVRAAGVACHRSLSD